MFTFIFSLAGMLFIVSDKKTDNMGIGEDEALQINLVDAYVSHHPVYYGLKKLGENFGSKELKETMNLTNGLMSYTGQLQKMKEEA